MSRILSTENSYRRNGGITNLTVHDCRHRNSTNFNNLICLEESSLLTEVEHLLHVTYLLQKLFYT